MSNGHISQVTLKTFSSHERSARSHLGENYMDSIQKEGNQKRNIARNPKRDDANFTTIHSDYRLLFITLNMKLIFVLYSWKVKHLDIVITFVGTQVTPPNTTTRDRKKLPRTDRYYTKNKRKMKHAIRDAR